MTAQKNTLNRYTSLASALHILQNKCLTLLDPDSWDDRNDAFTLKNYKARTGLKTLHALCFTGSDETYHHWRVFTEGTEGIRIEFRRDKLLACLEGAVGVKAGEVQYHVMKTAKDSITSLEDLPFSKRVGFAPEKEFRILYCAEGETGPVTQVPITLASIRRIWISPWLPQSLQVSVHDILKPLVEGEDIRVSKSRLTDSVRWQNLVERLEFEGEG